jgi:hypothetical protein
MRAAVADQRARIGSRTLVRLGWVAGLGAAWFVVAVLLLHALKSADYDFSAQTVSELAVGRYGFLMTSAFIALGIGELALAVGLWRAAGARLGAILQIVGGAIDLTSAIFEADLLGAPGTTHGAIHDGVGAVGALLVIPTFLAYAWAFRRNAYWRSFALPTLLWALAAFAAFVLVIVLGEQNQGTSERIYLAVYVSWLVTAAVRLVRFGLADVGGARLQVEDPLPSQTAV